MATSEDFKNLGVIPCGCDRLPDPHVAVMIGLKSAHIFPHEAVTIASFVCNAAGMCFGCKANRHIGEQCTCTTGTDCPWPDGLCTHLDPGFHVETDG